MEEKEEDEDEEEGEGGGGEEGLFKADAVNEGDARPRYPGVEDRRRTRRRRRKVYSKLTQ